MKDWTHKRFRQELAKRGWKQVLAWIEVANGALSVGIILVNGKPLYRESFNRAVFKEEQFTASAKARQA